MKTLLLGLILLATANIQMGPESPDYGERFGKIIEKAAERLQGVAEKRPLKLSPWNDSLAKTAEALRLMASRSNPSQAWKLLEEARKIHPANSFAVLLQAVMLNASDHEEMANEYFETFMLKSTKFTELEETFLHWGEFHMLRRTVFVILKSRGISFEGREEEIQAYIPYEQFFQYIMDPSRKDWMMNIALVILTLGGGLLLVISLLAGVDLSQSPAGGLLTMYVMTWIAYALWILDLAFGLPFGLSRHALIPIFLAASAVLIVAFELWGFISESRRPIEEGYRKCPHCGALVVELSVECFQCHRKLPELQRAGPK